MLKTKQETIVIINRYIRDQKIEIPQDIIFLIQFQFIDYYWAAILFDCDRHQLRDVIMMSMEEINDDTTYNSLIDFKRMSHLLKKTQMNGAKFCKLSEKEFCYLLHDYKICSMKMAITLSRKIYRFDFAIIALGSPVYLPLKSSK